MGKVRFTCSPSDLADVLELMEERVGRRSKQPGEFAYLGLLISECVLQILKDNWSYEEDYESVVAEMRLSAKASAVKMIEMSFGG